MKSADLVPLGLHVLGEVGGVRHSHPVARARIILTCRCKFSIHRALICDLEEGFAGFGQRRPVIQAAEKGRFDRRACVDRGLLVLVRIDHAVAIACCRWIRATRKTLFRQLVLGCLIPVVLSLV